jgi:NAD(P)-dependent dehydrogenase (short-subunit alcohol dehydrogenase family)
VRGSAELLEATGGLDAFAHGLAFELRPHSIRVKAVRPGLIEIHGATGEKDWIKKLVYLVRQGRSGQPEEVAEAVLWLPSP